MALSDTTSNSAQNEKPSTEVTKHEKREKPPTKVIIRRLPPGITQEEFIQQVSPLPDYDYLYAVKGDMSLGENSFSRVYINFLKSEDIYMFKEKFDNYVFVDTKGHEYAAVVEFSAFQKIPKKRGKAKPDPKIGTIESDPVYLEFLESLKQQPNQEEKPEFSYQPSSESKNEISTPLLDYLKQRKIDKLKSKEEKREERRKREIERKRLRDVEKHKRYEERSPAKSVSVKQSSQKLEISPSDKGDTKVNKEEEVKEKKEEKIEKPVEKQSPTSYKSKDPKKYDDYKSNIKYKSKYPNRTEKYESYEKRDYKSRRDDYRDRRGRYEDHRKDDYKKEELPKKEVEAKQFPKKVKKYSERREERKYEVRKAEQKKEDCPSIEEKPEEEKHEHEKPPLERTLSEESKEDFKIKEEFTRSSSKEGDDKCDDPEKCKNKENDPRVQRRIRNKDRPTMQLYQPGMLSKRRQQEDDKDVKEITKE